MMVTGGKEDLGLSLSLGMGLMGCSNKINNSSSSSSSLINVDVPMNNGSTSSSAMPGMGMGMGMGMGSGLGFLMMNRTNPNSNPNPNPNHQLEKLPWNRSTDSFPLSSSDRVSSSCLRGIDVNRPAGGCELEDDAGVSSPNSTVSTLSGSKRSSSDQDQEGADHDDEEDENSRKKLRLSKDQSAVLEESFKEHNTLNPKQKLALAKRLGLRPRQVEVWFQNRRARTKLKQTEVDCEFLKRCCEQLTEENRRLQKEVQELRALKMSPQFYMQMTPPTTLTMCPSCERVASSSSSSAATTTTNNNDLAPSRPGPSKAQAHTHAQSPPLNNALPLQLQLQLQQQQQHRAISVNPWLPLRPFDTLHPRP